MLNASIRNLSKFLKFAIFASLILNFATSTQIALADAKAAYNTCVACHGAKGEGNKTMNAPALSSQSPWYIARQIENFRKDVRGSHEKDTHGKTMLGMAKAIPANVSSEDLAKHISSLGGGNPKSTIEGDIARGKQFYDSQCGSCHGPKAVGNETLNSPKLSGIDDWYLKRQFMDFRMGIRGSHPDDKYGRQMKRMSGMLPDETTLNDVLAYLQSIEK